MRLLLAVIFIMASVAGAQAFSLWPFGKGIDYTIDIEGVDAGTRGWLKELALTAKEKEDPPENMEALTQLGVTRADEIRKALAAKGYFDAVVEHELEQNVSPPVLHYSITPGERYMLSAITLQWPKEALKSIDISKFPFKTGDAVDVQAINGQALRVQDMIGKDACLLSLGVVPVLQLDTVKHRAELIYRIEHGPSARFGPPLVTGNERVKDRIIDQAVKWKEGDCFRQETIDATRKALIETQLFASVKITTPTEADKDGKAAIPIQLTERVPRTIRAGANYATDRGAGVNLGWEHRNYFGGAERVTADSVLAEQEQSLTLGLRTPYFMREDQALNISGAVKNEDTDAYQSRSINTSAHVERKLNEDWNVSAGVAYSLIHSSDIRTGTENYGLISAPLFAEYDTRDNAQDAKKGWFIRAAGAPYADTLGLGTQFLKLQGTAQTYYTKQKMKYKPTLAFRANLGGISGASASDMPPDVRFYAGGGGSVRGFGYQSLNPRLNGEPYGGLSVFEASAEARLRFTPEIGGVLFVDAGNAYSSSLPQPGDKLYVSAGAGVRYYSPVGPLRLDVGIPLNGDDIGETGYGLYVSLGQAF